YRVSCARHCRFRILISGSFCFIIVPTLRLKSCLDKMRILLVEDEPRMANVIAKGLREQAYAVDIAEDGDAALYQTSINDYDLIILDVLQPARDGFEVSRELRARGDATPILMLTARATVDDRVNGFEAGADDYLTKPFSFRELVARVRALLRREAQLHP